MTPEPRSPTTRAGRFVKVTSTANDHVKALRALHGRKERQAGGLFLAEGLKLVRDAVEAGWTVDVLAYAAARARDPAVGPLAARTMAGGGTVLEASAAVLEKIARRDNPQTVVAAFRQRFAEPERIGTGGLWVALDRVRDPGNLGTIIRTADAAGAAGVALVGSSVDPFGVEAVRATMGSIFNVAVAATDEAGLIALAGRHGARLVGTHLTEAAIDYRKVRYDGPTILVMGNEQSGLGPHLAAACAELVRIPMRPGADSLNLAVSTGLMIYEALRPRLA